MQLTGLVCAVVTRREPASFRFVTELASAFGIRCEFHTDLPDRGMAGVIADGPSPSTVAELARLPMPSLGIHASLAHASTLSSRLVRFSSSGRLAWPFSGEIVSASLPSPLPELPVNNHSEVMASVDERPIWRLSASLPHLHQSVAFPIPVLMDGEMICDRCLGRDFFTALPLLFHFRRMIRSAGWQAPPLRACFMFDDPNLHSTRYGYLNYRGLADSALRHNYHVAIATIPLDAWLARADAVALFQEHRARLSLLIHGNDHVAAELAQPLTRRQRHVLIATALRRISDFEERTGLSVSRVMAAPHGACSEAMLGDLADFGFAAACISPWSLRDHNPDRPWLRRLGIATSEWINGLPVIPRFRLAADCLNSIRLAALLDQPIVPVGHHYDLRDGTELLETLATAIDALGEVQWCDTGTIARTNVWVRRTGKTIELRPYANRFRLDPPIPEGKAKIETLDCGLEGVQVWQGSAATLEFSRQLRQVDFSSSQRPRLSAVVRRFAVEARDRLMPVLNPGRAGAS